MKRRSLVVLSLLLSACGDDAPAPPVEVPVPAAGPAAPPIKKADAVARTTPV